MIKVGVFGATGRVGQLVIKNIHENENLEIGSIMVRDNLDFFVDPSVLVTDNYNAFIQACDVVVDFSLPDATEALLEASIKYPKPLVIGTTGLSEHQLNLMKTASELMPILYATNMSMGIAVLNKLVAAASKALSDFDIEIVEMHHRYKKDAPSGTALTLSNSAAAARNQDLKEVMINGRGGNIGERSKSEIAVMALRGGDIVGQHTVGFYNDGEFVQLHHTATSRETFSKGALKAASWLVLQDNGQYDITDCLGL
jgi:4-hydroxy-tetrahydrodipicolinate reductase